MKAATAIAAATTAEKRSEAKLQQQQQQQQQKKKKFIMGLDTLNLFNHPLNLFPVDDKMSAQLKL